MSVSVRPTGHTDRATVIDLLIRGWGEPKVVSRGRVHDATALPAFLALIDGDAVGLATYELRGGECELVTLNAFRASAGIGTALLTAVIDQARHDGAARLWLVTTNDNVEALRFYQRRGLRLVAVHRNGVAEARELKPSIPAVGADGIALVDEIELELSLP